jgi:hypothetical protein
VKEDNQSNGRQPQHHQITQQSHAEAKCALLLRLGLDYQKSQAGVAYQMPRTRATGVCARGETCMEAAVAVSGAVGLAEGPLQAAADGRAHIEPFIRSTKHDYSHKLV